MLQLSYLQLHLNGNGSCHTVVKGGGALQDLETRTWKVQLDSSRLTLVAGPRLLTGLSTVKSTMARSLICVIHMTESEWFPASMKTSSNNISIVMWSVFLFGVIDCTPICSFCGLPVCWWLLNLSECREIMFCSSKKSPGMRISKEKGF